MTSNARSVQNIHRLTDLRRGRLEHLRQEFRQLEQLAEGERAKVASARTAYTALLEETGQEEATGRLNVADMLSRRRYLAQLQGQLAAAEAQLAVVRQQGECARRDLEAMQAEVRSLERLGERREESLMADLRRREYGVSDDLALVRRFCCGEAIHG